MTAPRPRNNLPGQPTAFIGREQEIAEVARLLRQGSTRLLTLAGPGGIGKTRLAVQAASELLDEFPDGVWFVPLSEVSDSQLVDAATATAARIALEPGRSAGETLADALVGQRVLLVLDNAEHVRDAVQRLAERLFAAGPGPSLLVTSRVWLRLEAELRHAVGPLALPRPDSLPAAKRMMEYEAVRLFAARAVAVNPGFAVEDSNASAVAEICRRLDGLPLAIELAAARTRLLPPAALLARLHQRLPLLSGAARDTPERQRTLEATIAWSHELLDEAAKTAFRRMAVFEGSVPLEPIEAVIGAGEALTARAAVEVLLENNLLRAEQGDGTAPRFGMLQTLREYALLRLAEAREETSARRNHLHWFTAHAEAGEIGLHSPAQMAWLSRIGMVEPEFRAALAWAISNSPRDALKLASALFPYWFFLNRTGEATAWTAAALDAGARDDVRLRGKVLVQSGAYLSIDEMKARSHEALALARVAGDAEVRGLALFQLAWAALYEGFHAEAEAGFAEAEELLSMAGVRWMTYYSILWQATAAKDRDLGEMERQYGRALELAREMGDPTLIKATLASMAARCFERGQLERAEALAAEAACYPDAAPDDVFFGLDLQTSIAFARGNHERARMHVEMMESAIDQLDDRMTRVHWLNGLGCWLLELGETSPGAQRIREAIELLRETDPERARSAVVHSLGDARRLEGITAEAAARYAESLRLVLGEGAGALRAEFGQPEDPGASRRICSSDPFHGLSLIAAGLGEDAVAARLKTASEDLRATTGVDAARHPDERAIVEALSFADSVSSLSNPAATTPIPLPH